MQALGVRPILVGRFGAAVVHAMAALPWVVLLTGVGLCAVEPELEESALLEFGPLRVLMRITLRRTIGAILAAALAVAVLTAGDMTVTDLLQVRTYAEEAYVQFVLGRGLADAAVVALPPLIVLGIGIVLAGRALSRLDPARLASAASGARTFRLGRWRLPAGALLTLLIGDVLAFPLYSMICAPGGSGGMHRSDSRRSGRSRGWWARCGSLRPRSATRCSRASSGRRWPPRSRPRWPSAWPGRHGDPGPGDGRCSARWPWRWRRPARSPAGP